MTNVTSKQLNYKKEIVLKDNVKLSVANNLEIGNLSIEGTNTTIQPISGTATLNATSMVVNEGKQVDITKDVKLVIAYDEFIVNSKNYMLNVAGTLNNYGWIDTENSTEAEANKLSVLVANNGELINKGKLSQPAVKAFNVNSKEYKFVKSILDIFKNGNQNTSNKGARIVENTSEPDNFTWAYGTSITATSLKNILTKGTVVKIGTFKDGIYVGMAIQYNKKYYYFYDGSQDGDTTAKTIFESYIDKEADAQNALRKKDEKASTPIYMIDAILNPDNNNAYGPTWFYIYENLGTVDLLNGQWAYGEIVNGTKGTLKGQWSK